MCISQFTVATLSINSLKPCTTAVFQSNFQHENIIAVNEISNEIHCSKMEKGKKKVQTNIWQNQKIATQTPAHKSLY